MYDLINDNRCRHLGPIACRDCDLHMICQLTGLIGIDGARVRHATSAVRTISAGASVYAAGAPASSLFAIKEGMVKLVELTPDGDEHIASFHMPGEVLGLEAFGAGRYSYDAIALGPVRCCELSISALNDSSEKRAALALQLVQLLSRSVGAKTTFARGSARQRVTAFLIDLARRLRARGFDGTTLALKMSRQEIASLLDTRIETISRVLQQLNREGAIEVHGGRIRLIGLETLEEQLPSKRYA